MKPTKAAIKEQSETYPHLYAVECPLTLAGSLVQRWAAIFDLRAPEVMQSQARTVSWWSVTVNGLREECTLRMRQGFTLGDLAHEMAHSACWQEVGEHAHADFEFQMWMAQFCRMVNSADILAALDGR